MSGSKIVQNYSCRNGLKINVIDQPHDLFRFEIVVRAGMLAEEKDEHGYAHILEHLASFYPSVCRKNSIANQQVFTEKEIACNAWTSPYCTGYYLEGHVDYFDVANEYMYEHFCNPHWDSSIWDQEIQAVVQELTQHHNDPWVKLNDKINEDDYPNSVFKYGIAAEIESVKKATIDKVTNFRKKWYRTDNTVIFITLNSRRIPNLLNNIQKWNNLYLNKTEPLKKINPGMPVWLRGNGYSAFIQNDVASDYRINISWPIMNPDTGKYMSWKDIRIETFNYLSMFLTENMGSVLMKELRGDKGLIYNIGSYTLVNYLGPSRFTITVNTHDPTTVVKSIFEKIKKFKLTSQMMNAKSTRDKINKNFFEHDVSFRLFTKTIETRLLWCDDSQIDTPQKIHNIISQYSLDELQKIFDATLKCLPTCRYSGPSKGPFSGWIANSPLKKIF